MAPIQAIRSLHLPMRSAGFLLPTLAALALASCTAPPPSPPPTASVPPSAPQQLAPPSPPPPAAPASPMAKAIFEANRSGQAPFVSPGEMSLSGPPPGASPRSRLNPPPPVEPPVNKQVADLLNSADTEQRSEYGGDGCFYVGMAISNANDRPIPTAQRAEVKRYADRCKLRFQP